MEQDSRLFMKNMLKSTFKTKVSNTEEFTSPIVDAIRENTEAIKDKDVAKQISKPIVTALVDVIEKIGEKSASEDSKLDKFFERIQVVKGEDGVSWPKPTDEELLQIIEPLIPAPIKGDPGEDYVLTAKDKKEIAKAIKVPIVEKIIEHTVETIVEKTPIITNEIKEVAVADTPEALKEKLESLNGDERLDSRAIKNLPKQTFGGGINRIDSANDVRIVSPTNGQTLVWNAEKQVWVNSTGGSGAVDGAARLFAFMGS